MTYHELTTYFTELHETYRPLVFNRIHQFITDYHVCEDLTQETFIRAWLALPTLDTSSNVRGWLYTIASNIAKDYFRSNRYKENSHVSLTHWQSEEVTDDIAAQVATKEQIQQALSAMPEQHRRLFYLYDVYGYTLEDLERALQKTRTCLFYHTGNARKAFRAAYAQAS